MSETVIIDARRLRELASQVSRLLPDRRDPHRFHEQKSEAVAQLRALAVGNCTAVAASARLRVFSNRIGRSFPRTSGARSVFCARFTVRHRRGGPTAAAGGQDRVAPASGRRAATEATVTIHDDPEQWRRVVVRTVETGLAWLGDEDVKRIMRRYCSRGALRARRLNERDDLIRQLANFCTGSRGCTVAEDLHRELGRFAATGWHRKDVRPDQKQKFIDPIRCKGEPGLPAAVRPPRCSERLAEARSFIRSGGQMPKTIVRFSVKSPIARSRAGCSRSAARSGRTQRPALRDRDARFPRGSSLH